MMTFLLGDGAGEIIENSYIELNVKVLGIITKAEGLEKNGSDVAALKIRLLDILVLDEPVDFELRWK